MEDLGGQTSYLSIERGMPVLSADGEKVGEVEHLLADPEVDVFDGLVLDTSVLPGGHRFVDASQVDRVHERGVVLGISAADAERLPEPSESPAALEVGPEDLVEDDLKDKLRRAWDLISGNY
jgi:hypothetical protein